MREMFLDKNGKLSFKRIMGGIGFIVAVSITFMKMDHAYVYTWLGFVAACVGFSIGERGK